MEVPGARARTRDEFKWHSGEACATYSRDFVFRENRPFAIERGDAPVGVPVPGRAAVHSVSTGPTHIATSRFFEAAFCLAVVLRSVMADDSERE